MTPPRTTRAAVSPTRVKRGLLLHLDGTIESDVTERPVGPRSHWLDWLPVLAIGIALLASLPLLIQIFLPLAILIVAILVVPMFLFPSSGGCITSLFGMILPRGPRSAKVPSSDLSFRVRTSDGHHRDIVLRSPRARLQLGDDVRVAALRGRAPVHALMVVNRTSPGRYLRQGVVASMISAAFLLLAVVSLLASGSAR